MSLYLKYRPKTISELDLSTVRESLEKIVESNRVSHAYLFTGPRGAGKTSAARILARLVNCEKTAKKLAEPCNSCGACEAVLTGSGVDVLEIDAASNRGIDDVRELKERIKLAPAYLRRKVYIIDEVHMMTTEAFNALLKTLEEPPEHALFILCTTEAHKVPETIVSRCTRVVFRKATQKEMLRSLERVVKGEKAQVSEEALKLLSVSVDGSFRDGVKVLDQLLSDGGKVGVEEMEQALYGAVGFAASELAQALSEREMQEALEAYREGLKHGVDLVHMAVSVMKELKEMVLAGKLELVELIYEIDEVVRKTATSQVPDLLMEIMIIRWCGISGGGEPARVKESPEKKVVEVKKEPGKRGVEEELRKSKKRVEVEYEGSELDLWKAMLSTLDQGSYSLGALLAKARPGLMSGNELTIEVAYEFHRDQIMLEKHRKVIEGMVSEVVGQEMIINCVVVESGKLQSGGGIGSIAEVTPEEEELLTVAEEIFSN